MLFETRHFCVSYLENVDLGNSSQEKASIKFCIVVFFVTWKILTYILGFLIVLTNIRIVSHKKMTNRHPQNLFIAITWFKEIMAAVLFLSITWFKMYKQCVYRDMCPHTRPSLNGHGTPCDVTKFVFDPDFTSFPPMFKMEKERVFKMYEEFEAALKPFSVATHSLIVKRSSESVKELIVKPLKYESILFVCKHSPSKHTSSLMGQRPCQS